MNNSKTLFENAQQRIPGGVNSPVRAFRAIGGRPPFIERAKGAKIWDVEGNEYIDFVASWGPMILGHAHDEVIEAVQQAASRGTSFGANCEIEVEMADFVVNSVPSIDKVRMVNSGTEATMSAIRLARAFTGKDNIIKFEGCYHGHGDAFLSKAGSGAMTLGIPGSPGVTVATARHTLNGIYNDLESVKTLVAAHPEEFAAIIVEPVAGNMGVIPPKPEFLQGLRDIADEYHIVLIFDEVISGFRLGLGGAQQRFDVLPDITTLGKIIGGGLPVGAFGGKAEIMDLLAPLGPVYQAGTLSGNPLALTAGLTTLKILSQEGFYGQLEGKASRFFKEWAGEFDRAGIPSSSNQIGSMASAFFTAGPVHNYDQAAKSDTELFARYFRMMLAERIYLAPSQFEAMFVSAAHGENELAQALSAHRKVLSQL
jgi:glutamate-1-semialdehyde 2,1-aminomutase